MWLSTVRSEKYTVDFNNIFYIDTRNSEQQNENEKYKHSHIHFIAIVRSEKKKSKKRVTRDMFSEERW
jgi:hypothetical protein